MKVTPEDLLELMSKKSDEDLLEISFVHYQDYTREAIEAARSVYDARELVPPKGIDILTQVKTIKERERIPLSWILKFVAFFFSSFFLFIPAILLHAHFTDKGEKRKAQDLKKWSVYGIVFYLALGVIRFLYRLG